MGRAALRGSPQRLRETPTMAPVSRTPARAAVHRPHPARPYAALRHYAADGSLPSAGMTVLGLDEYLGLGADDPRSFHADLDRELAGIPIGRREALDGAAADPTPKPRATRPSSTRRRSTSPYSGSGATRTWPSTSRARGPATACGAWRWTRRPSPRPPPTSAAPRVCRARR
jgi:hypothetical protein